MRISFLILLSIVLLSACTSGGIITQNPKVEGMAPAAVLITTKDTKKVINKLAEICDRDGFQIDDTGTNNVNCSTEAPILAQAFLGTRYGTNVRSRLRFNVITLSTSTKIVGKAWFENQTAFGQTRTHELDGGEAKAYLQKAMQQA